MPTILFNHESPRRGLELEKALYLGNLEARRDWGHSREYVEQIYAMLQQDTPEDFLIATGETHSVRDFAEQALSVIGLNFEDYVVGQTFYRPSEVDLLVGNPEKARSILGWKNECSFAELVDEIVTLDLVDESKLENNC